MQCAKRLPRHPVIQEIGRSAERDLGAEHGDHRARDEGVPHPGEHVRTGWCRARSPSAPSQISDAELAASTTQLSVESKNDQPTSFAVIDWATIFGIVIALGVLGMSVGLVRSETASDLRTLAATGASSYTRRTLTAVTAGALGFLGALLGTVGGYIGMIGWLREQLAERRDLRARERPGRGPPLHPPRHAGLRRDRRLGSSPVASPRRWPTSRSSEPTKRREYRHLASQTSLR